MLRAFAIATALSAALLSVPVLAQDAAETAIILSGSGQAQGHASRSLGGNITLSMGNAANAIAATSRPHAQASSYRYQPRRSRKAGGFAIALPADVDPLETTDAPSYVLGNGATIRVSGGLRQPVQPVQSAACTTACPK